MKVYFTFLLLLLCATASMAQDSAVVAPADLQLKGYNNHDIDTFAKAYCDTVKVYSSPGVLNYQEKEELRKRYGSKFANTPDLHCELVNRIVSGNVVIMQISKDRPRVEAIAVYRVKDSLIYEVTFISPDKK